MLVPWEKAERERRRKGGGGREEGGERVRPSVVWCSMCIAMYNVWLCVYVCVQRC